LDLVGLSEAGCDPWDKDTCNQRKKKGEKKWKKYIAPL
jgi:hypothetical protein